MIVVISIFLKTNVLAEQNKGKLYELYYKEANVNVFAKDVRRLIMQEKPVPGVEAVILRKRLATFYYLVIWQYQVKV